MKTYGLRNTLCKVFWSSFNWNLELKFCLYRAADKSETDIISEKAARLKLPTLAWKDALKKHLSGILTAGFRTCVSLSIVETGQIEKEDRNHLIEDYMSFSVSSLTVFLFPNFDGVREH